MILRSEPLEYSEYVERLKSADKDIAEQVAGFSGIDHVLQWMQQHELVQTDADIVGQDEFSYDFLLRLVPTSRWLSFAVT
jgi:hypothetical protein